MVGPFDPERYARLLEGLEVTEMRPSDLDRTDRIDAEFFQREYVHASATIARMPNMTITEVAHISDGNHFAISEDFVDEGLPYYRGQDVAGHFFVEQSTPYCISEAAYSLPFMKRSHLLQGDVLLSIVGTIGELSLVTDTRRATCSCKLAILRSNSIEPGYLAIFLSSRHGQALIDRWTRGAVQKGLLLEDMQEICVPRFASDFEKVISRLVVTAQVAEHRATELLQSAEKSLGQGLGLDNDVKSEELGYRRTLQQVSSAERFDAEYFDPRKEDVIRELSALSGRALGEYVFSVKQILDPTKPDDQLRVRNYDLPDALAPILGVTKEIISSVDLGSTKKIARDGDVVISRLRSYLREIAIVQADESVTAVVSTEFIVLRFREGMAFPQEALWTFLRSDAVQTILRYCVDGSQHPRFSESDLLRIPVPDVVFESAPEIAVKFRMATSARERAAALLERAKRAVDVAIEGSEEAALAFLRSFGG